MFAFIAALLSDKISSENFLVYISNKRPEGSRFRPLIGAGSSAAWRSDAGVWFGFVVRSRCSECNVLSEGTAAADAASPSVSHD